MQDETPQNVNANKIHAPELQSRSGPSLVWIVPVITLLVGAWLIFSTLSAQGPVVELQFQTANGIQAGKTRVKYKSVDIGLVRSVRFSENFDNVVLTVDLDKGTDNFLRRSTNFWIVRPQLSLRGASGLGTLLSGAYIEIDPGEGAPQSRFIGLQKAPLVTSAEAGQQITLVAEKLGSIDTGSPVYYRGVLAGEVLGHELGDDRQSVFIHAFIRDPFDQMIRGNTRFWNVSGVSVEAGATGFKVQTESLQSLIYGGLAFDTPDTLETFAGDVGDLVFTLHPNIESIEAKAFTQKLKYVMYFDQSVRGLQPGAPVEFAGLKMGSVLDIRLEYNDDDLDFRIPILVEIEPERMIRTTANGERSQSTESAEQTIQRLIDRGLRARLNKGSLLTGQLYVDLVVMPESEPILVGNTGSEFTEMPTVSGGLEGLQRVVENFAAKIDQLDIDTMARNLNGILSGANGLVNSPDIDKILANANTSILSLRRLLRDVDIGNLNNTIASALQALESLDETLRLAGGVLDNGSPLQYNVTRMSAELEETARAIRSLVDSLERRPQSLIFGRDKRKRR